MKASFKHLRRPVLAAFWLPVVAAVLLVVVGLGSEIGAWLYSVCPCPAWLFWLLWLAPLFSIAFSYQTQRPRLRALLHRVGECWLGVFLYLSLAFALRWLANLAFTKGADADWLRRSGWWALTLFAAVYAAGVVNALHIRIRRYQLELDIDRPLRLALVSDLHLGFFSGQGLLRRLGKRVAALQAGPCPAEALLIAGDIFDMEYTALRQPDARAAQLAALPLPVYACLGNHDLLAPDPRKDDFMQRAGMTVLRDEAVELGPVRLLGRRDRNDPKRANDAEVYAKVCGKPKKPLLVLDHQPVAFRRNWTQGADLVLSGHTHGGQTFPGNLLFALLPTPAYGCRVEDGRQLVVTSGCGFWGPPLRVGVHNELVLLELRPVTSLEGKEK